MKKYFLIVLSLGLFLAVNAMAADLQIDLTCDGNTSASLQPGSSSRMTGLDQDGAITASLSQAREVSNGVGANFTEYSLLLSAKYPSIVDGTPVESQTVLTIDIDEQGRLSSTLGYPYNYDGLPQALTLEMPNSDLDAYHCQLSANR